MSEDSALLFEQSRFKYGEWETIGDRIKRRPIFLRAGMTNPWLYEVEIRRNYDGEEFTATTRFPPEMFTDTDRTAVSRFLVDSFFNALASAIEQRDGNWMTA